MYQHVVETFTAQIYCGFKPGYDGIEEYDSMAMAAAICQNYCDKYGMAFTIEPTRFIYKGGNENGVKVGLINYPRFPKRHNEIKNIALEIAAELKEHFKQHRVSIVCSDVTIMLGEK
jgi:hypothetical protein